MLPKRSENIYPKTDENIQAIFDYYFSDLNVGQTGAIERLKENNILSLNQIEYLIKKLSEAYIPIFRVHLKTPIELQNLIKYGLDAIVYQDIKKSGSKSRQNITLEFQNFVKENSK
ncbi:hypothetical protein [Flavobacterium sp. F52]|uniref:hypothetical protein n=1 Tax=Flavobacterium sp. F52 TaxID=1202532 RepID=UPI000272DF75|nr:hypothetical protein [Flavobacterium sp. F52]EJG03398.1 hypothetical protein FF52_00575 [Flavobacterium sp. F52]